MPIHWIPDVCAPPDEPCVIEIDVDAVLVDYESNCNRHQIHGPPDREKKEHMYSDTQEQTRSGERNIE